MKKSIVKFICAGLCLGLLTGCSSSKNESTSSSDNNIVEDEVTTESTQSEQTSVTLKQAIDSDERTIWLMVNDVEEGKDADVVSMVLSQSGKLTVIDLGYDYKLGDFAKLNDDEIIDTVYNNLVQKNDENISEILAVTTASIETIPTDDEYVSLTGRNISEYLDGRISGEYSLDAFKKDMTDIKADLEQIKYPTLEELESPYKIGVYTDPSGNNTETEMIAYYEKQLYPGMVASMALETKSIQSDSDDSIDWQEKDYWILEEFVCETYNIYEESTAVLSQIKLYPDSIKITGTTYSPIQVYDSYYSGFCVESDFHADADYMLCRINTDVQFSLDEVGTEGIEIDNDELYDWDGLNDSNEFQFSTPGAW